MLAPDLLIVEVKSRRLKEAYVPRIATIIALFVFVTLGACAVQPPRLAEFWGGPRSTTQKVLNITSQVACELGRTIDNLASTPPYDWLNSWGAAISLSIDAREKIEVNPGVSINRPLPDATTTFFDGSTVQTDQIFNLGIGIDGSTETTKKGTLAVFYTVPELRKIYQHSDHVTCLPAQPAEGYLFAESDLGLQEWINAAVTLQSANVAVFPKIKRGPYGQNTISETIKFDIVSSGSVTPAWKLVRVSANRDATLFNAQRERTQEIEITLGPMEKPGVLVPAAQAQFNAQLIAAALRRLGR